MTKGEKLHELISERIKSPENIDLMYHLDEDNLEDVYDFQDVFDILMDNRAFDVEIIYYSNAIEYLQENDPSLNESLSLADELGYGVNDLNSELLASLLASEIAKDEFYELEKEINGLIEEAEEYIDNLEEEDDEN